ncbi:hypothetical protein PNOK_0121100 [Pyrrhoderma noxium]|uniref:Uncharacterized protein n=1 Tax=Pyrrhoderma noxium TaxID=2282107 RepID=A0A286UX16_9AGAM|nr:hypothetical protein PNOK_0121100 [Pyrrhoderma noxium]
MSTTAVAPFRYTTDLSKRSIQEVNATIDQFEHNIQRITPPKGGDYTIFVQNPDQESRAASAGKVWRVSIYILDLVIAFNSATGTISLEAYVNIPIIGSVNIGQISGSLTDGVNLSLGYPGVLSGSVGIRLSGGTVFLSYSFSALGFTADDEIPLFTV